jgi:hypothetical protein
MLSEIAGYGSVFKTNCSIKFMNNYINLFECGEKLASSFGIDLSQEEGRSRVAQYIWSMYGRGLETGDLKRMDGGEFTRLIDIYKNKGLEAVREAASASDSRPTDSP